MHGSCVARTVNQFQDVKSPASPLAPLGGGGGVVIDRTGAAATCK